jgi:hypothetical protein
VNDGDCEFEREYEQCHHLFDDAPRCSTCTMYRAAPRQQLQMQYRSSSVEEGLHMPLYFCVA